MFTYQKSIDINYECLKIKLTTSIIYDLFVMVCLLKARTIDTSSILILKSTFSVNALFEPSL